MVAGALKTEEAGLGRGDGEAKYQSNLVLRTVLAKLALAPATALASFLVANLTIRALGAEGYGAVSVYVGLVAMLPFLDLGIGAAVVDSIARSGVTGDTVALLKRAAKMLLTVSAALLLLGAIITALGTWDLIMGDGAASVGKPNAAGLLFMAILALAPPLSLGQRVLLATNRQTSSVVISAVGSISAAGIAALLYLLDPAAWVYVAIVPSGLLVAATLSTGWALHKLPQIKREWRNVTGQQAAYREPVFQIAAPMLIVMVCVPLALHSDRLILSHSMGDDALASYALVYQMYLPVYAAIAAGLTSLWPIFLRHRATGGSMRKAWHSALVLSAGLALGLGLCLGALMRPVGSLIGQGTVEIPLSLVISVVALLFVQVIHYPSAMLLMDATGLRSQAILAIAMLVINVTASLALVNIVGLWGPVAASALSVFLCQLVPTYVLARAHLRETECLGS